MRNIFCALLCCAVAGLLGCSSETKLGPVSGSVSLDGKPVTAGMVTLVAADHSNTASTEITPEGTYAIADAPRGEVVVCVRTRDREYILGPGTGPPPTDSNSGSVGVSLNQKKNPLYVRTPKRYEDAAKSDLKTTISKTGEPATYDIKMTK